MIDNALSSDRGILNDKYICTQDFEGTEHDGDVEDYSDNESTEPEQMEKLMYYPQNEETSR